MAAGQTKTIDVTTLVGSVAENIASATTLANVVMKTVQPTKWFAMGGHHAVQPVFNPSIKKWFLSIYFEEQQVFDDVNNLITTLKSGA
jgi:hypothetical protein